jgi:hypothetical protein
MVSWDRRLNAPTRFGRKWVMFLTEFDLELTHFLSSSPGLAGPAAHELLVILRPHRRHRFPWCE